MHQKIRRPVVLAVGAAGVAIVAALTPVAVAGTQHQQDAPHASSASKPTVVLVHGAWSDSASWGGVIKRLHADGYRVSAAPVPLRGVASDAAYLADYLKTVPGPVILVGHSYGGAVITNAARGNPNVKGLVYVAAYAPDKGESTSTLTAKFPGSHVTDDPNAPVPTALSAVPYTQNDGTTGIDLYLKADKYRDLFLNGSHTSAAEVAELAAEQRPVTAAAVNEPSGDPAWKSIPSWFLVAKNDHTIPPAAQRFMAERAHGYTVEVPAPHVVAVTDPGAVTHLVEKAANAR